MVISWWNTLCMSAKCFGLCPTSYMFQAKACQDSSSGCGHRVCCWLDRRSLPSRLLVDLVSCTLGPTSHSGAGEQRAWFSPAVPAMAWWAIPRQVWEAIPRGTQQSHSIFPQPTAFEGLCQSAQCFYSAWLVLPAYVEVFGPDAAVTARIGQRGLSDQSVLPMGWQYVAKHSSIPVLAQPKRSRYMVRGSVCTADCLAWYDWHWPSLPQEDLCLSASPSLYPHANGGIAHVGRSFATVAPIKKHHLWTLGPGYLAGRLEELLNLNRPCRAGEDVHDSVLPTSHWQAWKTWDIPKKR